MRLSKKQREQILKQHCGVIRDDDAVDPKHYFYNKRKPRSKHRKAFQLCRQVSDTLQYVLNGMDPLFDDLNIVDVVPAPDARRMLVILAVDQCEVDSGTQVEEIMTCLRGHTPRLRSEIARSISRRKTPQLVFEITTV